MALAATGVTLDVAAVRKDFPILDREVAGHRLVYLDSAASSQKPRSVLWAMEEYYEARHANVHRGVYALAEEATGVYEGARRTVGRFIGARSPREVVFTDRRAVDRVRAAAGERTTAVGGSLRVEGPVALWTHPEVPLLASAVLVAPHLLLDRIAAAGLDLQDPYVVVTPHSPLACADAGVAARLAGETGEACQRLPWRQIPCLRWI